MREVVAIAPGPPVAVPPDIALEGSAALSAMTEPDRLVEVGEHTQLTCPECKGPLHRLGPDGDHRYRCHVGHSFDTDTLLGAQGLELERALWVAYRTLVERARMLEGLVRSSGTPARPHMTSSYQERLRETRGHVEALRKTLAAVGAPGSPDQLTEGEPANE